MGRNQGTYVVDSPSVVRILGGMFRPAHIKQFCLVAVSICFLLMIIRVMRFKTFSLIVFICLIAILVVGLIQQCTGGHSQKDNAENQYEVLQNHPNPSGISKSAPVYELKTFYRVAPSESVTDQICGICLQPLRSGSQVASLKCMHQFHPSCLDQWVRVRSMCPVCRAPLVD